MNILHLSDLHFGLDKDETMKAQRKTLLDSLIDTVCGKNIGIVLITGDISWQCKASGYDEAAEWVKKLLAKLSLTADRLIVCVGNHDLDHDKCIDMVYQTDKEVVGKSLRQERIGTLSERFSNFISWCSFVGVKKYKLGDKENYLIGSITIENIEFWVLNSAWYAFKGGPEDKGKLWIGDNFVDYLIAQANNKPSLRFALHHHPYEWINENEILAYNTTSRSVYRKLSCYVKGVFTGHTHAIQGPPNKFENKLYCFGTGATYVNNTYNNCFCIYSVGEDKSILEYTPYRIEDDKWEPRKTETIKLSETPESGLYEHTALPEATSVNNEVTYFKKLLENNGFNLIKVNTGDFLVNRTIIWPVVPRLNLNNIHLAQLELMEQLVKCFGWRVLAIISNCGANPLSEDDTKVFIEKVEKRCKKVNINSISFEVLKDYFDNKPDISNEILQCFIKVSSSLPILELTNIKEKKYDELKRAKIQQDSVLDYILPVLQYAVIKYVSNDIKQAEGKKSIVIAGNDEKQQWRKAVNMIGDNSIGAILIPELNNQEGQNIAQDTKIPSVMSIIQCSSMDELNEAMQIDCVAKWFYRMFVLLPNYKDLLKIDIFNSELQNTNDIPDWDGDVMPDKINRKKLIEYVWSRIERDV